MQQIVLICNLLQIIGDRLLVTQLIRMGPEKYRNIQIKSTNRPKRSKLEEKIIIFFLKKNFSHFCILSIYKYYILFCISFIIYIYFFFNQSILLVSFYF